MRYGKMKFEVGCFCFSAVREFLQRRQFEGMEITFFESNGWLSREFIVKGSEPDLLSIKASLERWANS